MRLLIWLITGAIGVVYFIYGKKQTRLMFMIAGGALCIYPYFFSNIIVSIIIGVILIAIPLVISD
jgi:hypothetical protein